jgi:Fur family peroxide stress response transcriptional regulator
MGLFNTDYYLIIDPMMSLTLIERPASDSVIIGNLRKMGYKATSQRIAICRLVLSSREHPTAQRIYREVKRVHPTVSLATVYKTLQVLKGLRLIQELPLPQSETRFDSNVSPHLNAVCLQCGGVTDVRDQSLSNVVSRAASKTKFRVTGHRFDLYGVCDKCAGRRGVTA